MRKRIYGIIESSDDSGDDNRVGLIYDTVMMTAIVMSLIPLAFKESYPILSAINVFTVTLFIIDYLLRLMTADYKLKKGVASFFLYPFSVMAIIDLLSILPSLALVHKGFKLLRLSRLLRAMRVFRVFKVIRYSKAMKVLRVVVSNSKEALIVVMTGAVSYVIISALLVFNVEPDSFNNFFDAVYWAVISLTTVGYGDLYPVSETGRLVAMLSSFFGIAVVALPAGIITAGYIEALEKFKQSDHDELNT